MSARFKIYVIAREAFHISLTMYLLAILLEVFRPGLVGNFINLNIVLLFVLLSGVGMSITEKKSA